MQRLSTMPSENGRNGNLKRTVPLGPNRIRNWFGQRWQANGHEHFFGGPKEECERERDNKVDPRHRLTVANHP
jgi:hypothetical protein